MDWRPLKSAIKKGTPPGPKNKGNKNPTFILITKKPKRSVSFNNQVEQLIFQRDLPPTLECHDCAFGFDTVELYEGHFRDVHPELQNQDDSDQCQGTTIIPLYDPDTDEPRSSMRERRSSRKKKIRSNPNDDNFQTQDLPETTQDPDVLQTVPILDQSVTLPKKRRSDYPFITPEMRCYVGNCDLTFKTLLKAKEHLREDHKEFPAHLVLCRTCSQLMPTLKALEAHKVTAHPRNFKCNICERKFETETAKKVHLSRAHGLCDDNGKCVEKGEAVFLKRVFQAHFKSQGLDTKTGKQVFLT